MPRRAAALFSLVCALCLGCGEGEVAEQPAGLPPVEPEVQELWSGAWEVATEDLAWSDLPGIEQLAELPPEARSAAIAVANRQKCPCGCRNHTVADCLNFVEGCLTARDRAIEIAQEAALRLAELSPPAPPVETPGQDEPTDADPSGAQPDSKTPEAAAEEADPTPAPEGTPTDADPARVQIKPLEAGEETDKE